MTRTSADLAVVVGEVRALEWFWAANGSMPGLDTFESLDSDAREAIVATFRYWADLPHGKRALESRVNAEHESPKILVAKAGKHRFTMFHVGDETWIIHRYYPKGKTKLDRVGRIVVNATVHAIADYSRRVKDGEYYERE